MTGKLIQFPKTPKQRCDCGWPFPTSIRVDAWSDGPPPDKVEISFHCPECGKHWDVDMAVESEPT